MIVTEWLDALAGTMWWVLPPTLLYAATAPFIVGRYRGWRRVASLAAALIAATAVAAFAYAFLLGEAGAVSSVLSLLWWPDFETALLIGPSFWLPVILVSVYCLRSKNPRIIVAMTIAVTSWAVGALVSSVLSENVALTQSAQRP